MDKTIVVFWQDGCLPVESSVVTVKDDTFPITELNLLTKYEHIDEMQLWGKTQKGDCVSVHRSIEVSGQHNHCVRNFDAANLVPIEDQNDWDSFDSYSSEIVLMDAFIGDRFIEENNPEIDKVSFQSADLALLCRMTPFSEDDYPSITLFENECARLDYWRGSFESHNLFRRGSDFNYGLAFEFKEPMRLEWAMRNWVNPIVNLLSVLLCGDIIADDIVFCSKSIGAEFRRFNGFHKKREEDNKPKINRMLFPFSNMSEELSSAISSWMERPNTLRGISDVYPHARYRGLLEETRFSYAMRLAEAAYADSEIADVVEKNGIERLPNGVVDLEADELRPVKRIVKKLSSSRDFPFREKISSLGNRFDGVYRKAGFAINWDDCVKECKEYRDAEAHGTLLGGMPQTNYDKMYALEEMALLFYELAVLDLLPVDIKAKGKAQQHLFELRRRNVTIGDFWPR